MHAMVALAPMLPRLPLRLFSQAAAPPPTAPLDAARLQAVQGLLYDFRRKATRPRLQAGQVLRGLEITGYSHDMRGIAHTEHGVALSVFGALEGEVVTARVDKARRQMAFATCTAVESGHSPHRVTPPCQYFGECGGCTLMHMDPAVQASVKERVALAQLQRLGKVAPREVLPLVTRGVEGALRYRRRGRLWAPRGDGGVKIGFRKRLDPGDVVDLRNGCPVLQQDLGDVRMIGELRECLEQLRDINVAHIDMMAYGNRQRYIALQEAQDDPGAESEAEADQDDCPGAAGDSAPEEELWRVARRALGRLAHGSCSASTTMVGLCRKNGTRRVRRWIPLASFIDVRAGDGGTRRVIFRNQRPDQFAQANEAINAELVSAVVDAVGLRAGDSVIDLFCGSGNLTLPLVAAASWIDGPSWVLGIDNDEAAIRSAKTTVTHNGMKPKEGVVNQCMVRFASYDLYNQRALRKLVEGFFDERGEVPQLGGVPERVTLLLDPPRTGALPVFRTPGMLDTRVKKVVYVSCNQGTLARDAQFLIEQAGFTYESLRVLDMFPNTSHTESLSVFTRE